MSGIYSALGRIGRNAEVRQTQNGTSVAGFPVAVDVGFGDNKTTLWLDCSLWGKRAESGLIQHLGKGQQVHVIGEIGTRTFQKNDGSPGFAVTLKVSEIDLAGGGQQQSGQSQQRPQQQQPQQNHQQAQATYAQQQQQQQNQPQGPGGGFDSFNDEIPFRQAHYLTGG